MCINWTAFSAITNFILVALLGGLTIWSIRQTHELQKSQIVSDLMYRIHRHIYPLHHFCCGFYDRTNINKDEIINMSVVHDIKKHADEILPLKESAKDWLNKQQLESITNIWILTHQIMGELIKESLDENAIKHHMVHLMGEWDKLYPNLLSN